MSSGWKIWNRLISLLVGITMVLSLTASASGETASLVSHMETTIRTIGPGQPSPLWRSGLGAHGADLVVNLGDRILLGTMYGKQDYYSRSIGVAMPQFGPLESLDPQSGRVLWRKERKNLPGGVYTLVAVEPVLVLRGQEKEGTAFYDGIDLTTGATLWEQRAGVGHSFAVVTSPDELVIAEASGRGPTVRAIALRDGAMKWTRTLSDVQAPARTEQRPGPVSPPVRLLQSGSDVIAVGSAVTALASSTGEPRWTVALQGQFSEATKAVLDGPNLYLATDASLSLLGLQDGKCLWQQPADVAPDVIEPTSEAVLTVARRQIPDGGSYVLRAFDPRSGQPRWGHAMSGAIHSVLLVTQKAAYYTTLTRFIGVSMATGAVIFDQPLSLAGAMNDLPDLLVLRGQHVLVARETGITAFSVPGGAPAWTITDFGGESYTQSSGLTMLDGFSHFSEIVRAAEAAAKKAPAPGAAIGAVPANRPTPAYVQMAQDHWRSVQSSSLSTHQERIHAADVAINATASYQRTLRTQADLQLGAAVAMAGIQVFTAIYTSYKLNQMQETGVHRARLKIDQASTFHFRSILDALYVRPFHRPEGWGVIVVDLDTGRSADLWLTPGWPIDAGAAIIGTVQDLQPALFATDSNQQTLYVVGTGLNPAVWETYRWHSGKYDWVIPYPAIMSFDLRQLRFAEPNQGMLRRSKER